MATTTTQIQQLYVAYLGRAADKAGLDYWSNQLNGTPATLTLDDLRANFVNEQPEYAAAYGGLSRVDTVTKIYNNLFGRAPDSAGLTYWTTGGGANVSADDLLVAFINGAGTTDSATITNKVLVSELYTSAAGTNYLAADAKSVITGVTDTSASLTAALAKLTDGSLSGIALGTATVNLKASVSADAAVTSYETNQLAAIKAIGAQLETLTKANAQLPDQTVNTGATTYTAADTDLSGDLTAARAGALGGKTTATLTTEAATAATALTDAATALRTADAASVDKMTAFDTASKAVAANKAVATDTKTEVTAALQAFGDNAANATVWDKALADSGATNAQTLYTFLTATGTTSAQVTTITNDFAGVTAFTAFGTAAAQDKLAVKAAADLSTATQALTGQAGTDYVSAYEADATAKLNVTASTALDALDASYKAIDTAHDSLTAALTAANAKLVTADAGVVTGATVAFTDDATKSQVFYFAAADKKAAAADGSVTLEAGKDSLYIGEGYTLNKTAALGSTGITGADNNSLEVFFVKDTASNNVKAVIETSVAASTTVTTGTLPVAADNVTVIELSGVTDVSQVSFANGIISHV